LIFDLFSQGLKPIQDITVPAVLSVSSKVRIIRKFPEFSWRPEKRWDIRYFVLTDSLDCIEYGEADNKQKT
jgi:hypothetical protein